MNQVTLYVRGMHCSACVVLIDDVLGNAPGITQARSNLQNNSVVLEGAFSDNAEELAIRLTPLISMHGYSLSTSPLAAPKPAWREFAIALPIALVLLALFALLQRSGLVNAIGGDMNYLTAAIIGLIASTSSCLAVVGGLVLSTAAVTAKSGGKVRSQTLFHLGRLGGFFVLGGLLGALGQSLTPGYYLNIAITLLVALVMLILGITMMDVFPRLNRFHVRLPSSAGKIVTQQTSAGPIALGAITFFLPCGFTQSMQLYALTTGNFWSGAATMLAFALGTLPVLALLSFGAFSLTTRSWKGIFYKTAGLVVVALAILNLINGLAVTGLIPPLITF